MGATGCSGLPWFAMGSYGSLWVAEGGCGLLWVGKVAMESRATTEAIANFCEAMASHSCLHSPNHKSPPHMEVFLLSTLAKGRSGLRWLTMGCQGSNGLLCVAMGW